MTADVKSGDWSYSLELSRALAGHGVRVSVSTSGGILTKEQRRDAARVPGLAIYDSGLTLNWSQGFPEDIGKSTSWLLSLEERLKPDIVHLNGFIYGPIAFNSPVVVAVHSGLIVLPEPLELTDRMRFRTEVSAVLSCADLVVSPTYALLEDLKANYRFPTMSKVIPYFRRASSTIASPKQKFVYSASRYSDRNGANAVIETIAHEFDWPVVNAVANVSSPNGHQLNGASRKEVRLTPSKMADQISKAAIYCLPTQPEPSDVSVLEGALSRCALVISDSPNLRENWNNCALFVPPDDSVSLRKSLQLLIVDEDLREELGQRAYERAKEFSPEKCIDDYLDAYTLASNNKLKSVHRRR